jgi:hypothetical protein
LEMHVARTVVHEKHGYIYIYTGCPRRNVPDFGRVFLMLKYTDFVVQFNGFMSLTS